MANELRLRSKPLAAFRIPSEGHSITAEQWIARRPNAVWYGIPVEAEYWHPDGGTYRRCSVEAFNQEGELLGYVPLPHRYAEAWMQLCYSVVYWLTTWNAWLTESGRPPRSRTQPPDMVRQFVNNSSARFAKYALARLYVVEELLHHPMSKHEDDELDVFDEFLIRDRWDLLWKDVDELAAEERACLSLDPVHPNNRPLFDLEQAGIYVDPHTVAPTPSPAHTWLQGVINHFDYQRVFDHSFPSLVHYMRQNKFRRLDDVVYQRGLGLPARWHEGHPPVIRLMSYEEDAEEQVLQRAPSHHNELPPPPPPQNAMPAPPPENLVPAPALPRLPTLPAIQREPGPSLPRNQETQPASFEPYLDSNPPTLERPGPSMLQNEQASLGTSSSGQNPGAVGPVDNPQTRAIVDAYALRDGGINLPEAHDQLLRLLGANYDASFWGKILDAVASSRESTPAMTPDEAFLIYGSAGGDANVEDGNVNFRKIHMNFYG